MGGRGNRDKKVERTAEQRTIASENVLHIVAPSSSLRPSLFLFLRRCSLSHWFAEERRARSPRARVQSASGSDEYGSSRAAFPVYTVSQLFLNSAGLSINSRMILKPRSCASHEGAVLGFLWSLAGGRAKGFGVSCKRDFNGVVLLYQCTVGNE